MRAWQLAIAIGAMTLATISVVSAQSAAPATRPSQGAGAATQPAGAAGAAATRPAASQPAAASGPGSAASRPVDMAETTADEVIRRLLDGHKFSVPPMSPTTLPAGQPATVAPEAIIKPLPMPSGAMVFNRLGRLIREPGSTWWTFRYESEKGVLYEPPMRILPNQQLEAMENILENSPTESVRFVISGEVVQYHGQEYLLIRKKLVKRGVDGL